MNRKRKLLANTIAALLYQVITIACGFVLPKYFIPHYGSAINGMINSITQFLGIITLMEAGVGAVVQSSLYKPLAEHDETQISRIMISSQKFFNKIMAILIVYVSVLMILYPLTAIDQFDFLFSAGLVLVLAITYIFQHYVYISYSLLLTANQLSYLQLGVHSVCLILNCLLSVILINLNASIHVVKSVSALVFMIKPFVLKAFVDHRFKLDMKIKLTEEPIKQKWNGFAQHIANVVLGNTDTVVLTLFSTLENVSVYSVYYLVVHGIRQILSSILSGTQALLGDMYARKEEKQLQKTFLSMVIIINFLVVLIYGVAGILLIPFIRIYTLNFTDANYIVPSFGIMLTLAYAMYSIRLPYEMMIRAAGHYRETQTSSIIEAILNVIISVALVIDYGLIGVAIGTLIAMAYRTIYLVFYLSKNILFIPITHFIKLICLDLLGIGVMYISTSWIKLGSLTYISWAIMAMSVGGICLFAFGCINIIAYRREILDIRHLLSKKTS